MVLSQTIVMQFGRCEAAFLISTFTDLEKEVIFHTYHSERL